jgi:hypothetical protein
VVDVVDVMNWRVPGRLHRVSKAQNMLKSKDRCPMERKMFVMLLKKTVG